MPSVRALIATLAAATALLASSAAPAQGPAPAVDWTSLLNVRFYPQSGGFLVERVAAAFVEVGATGEAVLTRGGERVAAVPLVASAHADPVFRVLEPNGAPGNLSAAGPGDYALEIHVGGALVTALPLTLARQGSPDPFAPGATWSREGPWRTLGFLAWKADPAEEDPQVVFHAWASALEAGAGGRGAPFTAHVLRGRTEIANASPRFAGGGDWQELDFEPKKERNALLRRSDLSNGRYAVVLRHEGRDVKRYPFRVEGGEVQPIPRGRLEHTPRAEMLLPRSLRLVGSSSRDHQRHVYWLEAAAR